MRLDMLCSDGLSDVVVSDRQSGVLRFGYCFALVVILETGP